MSQCIYSISEAFWSLLRLVPNIGTWKISPEERTYRLERMAVLLDCLDNPHLAYQTIHIAGSKGKGSTAAFLAAVLRAAGYRTGLYTSPHVSDPAERISAFPPPDDNRFIDGLVRQLQQLVGDFPPEKLPGSYHVTAFELVTLLGFLYFRAANCQDAIIETGIGGRHDATNVVQPIACLFTPVELEHSDVLGGALADVAREKSGIIKPGIPVFSSPQAAEVKDIFRKVSSSNHADIRFLDDEWEQFFVNTTIEGTTCRFRLRGQPERQVTLRLVGDAQAENASLACLALKTIFPVLSDDTIRQGLAQAFLPGRMEMIQHNPSVMLDGAHTPRAVQHVLSTFKTIFPQKGILLFGAVAGKNIEAMAEILAPAFQQVIISTPGTFKKSHPDTMFQTFQQFHSDVILETEPPAAFRQALTASQGVLPVLVTGSFFLVAEIRALFR